MNLQLPLAVPRAIHRIIRSQCKAHPLRDALANLHMVVALVFTLPRKAVHVDKRQFAVRVWLEELFLSGERADEGVEEVDCGGGEVHHVVIDGWRADVDLWLGRRGRGCGSLDGLAFLRLDGDGFGVLVEQSACGLADEFAAVHVECGDKVLDVVAVDGPVHRRVALRVEVVGPNEDPLAARGDGERSDARHNVADEFAGLELAHKSPVLGLKPAVPVDFGEVEAEFAILLVHCHDHVVVSGQDLERKCSEFTVAAHILRLVDHRSHAGILIFEDLTNQVLVGVVSLAEIEMHCMY